MPRFKVVMVATDMPPTPNWVPARLAEHGIDLVERACTSRAEVVRAAAGTDVVWIMGGSRILTAEVLPELAGCRIILRTGTGTDNIPVDAATRLGIVVANTPEATMHQVAEHTIGLLFAVIRQIAVQDRLVRRGIWDRHRAWPDWHLAGQTLGLAGFGRIARLVAKKTSGLELKVIACDPAFTAQAMQALGVQKVPLDDLLAQADFVSIHLPLCEQTTRLIGEPQLRRMKPRAVLINTARGAIVDQGALYRALREGWIAGAGIDVLDTEPPAPDDPLLQLDNVVFTPHIASYSDIFYENFWNHSIETLIPASRGGLPLWVVNCEVKPWWQQAGPREEGPLT
jgi:D-3-phosphoglycerate dehydrogenase